jgi:hypothetical protein
MTTGRTFPFGLSPAIFLFETVTGSVSLCDQYILSVELASVQVIEERLAIMIFTRPILYPLDQLKSTGQSEKSAEFFRARFE